MHTNRYIRPRLLAFTVQALLPGLFFAGLTPTPVAQAQSEHTLASETRYGFDIPAGKLSTALTRIAAQAGVQLTAAAELTAGRTAPAVQGTLTLQQAVERVLAGSGLRLVIHADGSYTLARQPEQSESRLPTVTVSSDWLGAATKADAKIYPGARTVMTTEEIHESGARHLEDVLRRVPGVRIEDETGTGVLPNIGIRGLNPLRSERVMVLQDDMPLALAPYTGTGLSLFPTTLESIERVDVVRGGVAVRYGPNNVGGVINLISRPVPREPSATVKQKLTIAGDNGNTLSDTYARFGGFLSRDFGIQLQANVLTGESFRDHSGTDVANFVLDADWFIDDDTLLKGRLQYYDVDADLPGALTPAAFENDRFQSQRPFDTFKADTLRGSLNLSRFIGDSGEFNWLNYAYTADREFTFGEPFGPDTPTTSIGLSPREFFVAGTEPRYTWRFETGGVTQKLTVGGRYVREEVDFIVDRRTLATGDVTRVRDWRFETDALAGYVSDTLGFMDDRLQITPGLRYEYVDTDFRDRLNGTDNNNDSKEPLPGLTIGYQASPGLYLFANANRSLRVPQVAQVTRSAPVESEIAWNYEIGARVSPVRSLDLSGTLFRIDFEDQIEFDRPSLTFQNLGETQHQGLELEAIWHPGSAPGLSLGVNYAFLDTEQESGQFEGNDVPFASEHQLNVSADYAINLWKFALTGHYQSDAFSDAANTGPETTDGAAGKIPSYWVWNAALNYDASIGTTPVSLGVAVNNLFDREYFFRGVDVSPIGRVPAAGRSVLVSIQLDF